MKVGSSPAVLGGGAGEDGAGGDGGGGDGGGDGDVQESPEYVKKSFHTDGIWVSNIAWIGSLLQSLNPSAPANIFCAAPRHMHSVRGVCPGCAVE